MRCACAGRADVACLRCLDALIQDDAIPNLQKLTLCRNTASQINSGTTSCIILPTTLSTFSAQLARHVGSRDMDLAGACLDLALAISSHPLDEEVKECVQMQLIIAADAELHHLRELNFACNACTMLLTFIGAAMTPTLVEYVDARWFRALIDEMGRPPLAAADAATRARVVLHTGSLAKDFQSFSRVVGINWPSQILAIKGASQSALYVTDHFRLLRAFLIHGAEGTDGTEEEGALLAGELQKALLSAAGLQLEACLLVQALLSHGPPWVASCLATTNVGNFLLECARSAADEALVGTALDTLGVVIAAVLDRDAEGTTGATSSLCHGISVLVRALARGEQESRRPELLGILGVLFRAAEDPLAHAMELKALIHASLPARTDDDLIALANLCIVACPWKGLRAGAALSRGLGEAMARLCMRAFDAWGPILSTACEGARLALLSATAARAISLMEGYRPVDTERVLHGDDEHNFSLRAFHLLIEPSLRRLVDDASASEGTSQLLETLLFAPPWATRDPPQLALATLRQLATAAPLGPSAGAPNDAAQAQQARMIVAALVALEGAGHWALGAESAHEGSDLVDGVVKRLPAPLGLRTILRAWANGLDGADPTTDVGLFLQVSLDVIHWTNCAGAASVGPVEQARAFTVLLDHHGELLRHLHPRTQLRALRICLASRPSLSHPAIIAFAGAINLDAIALGDADVQLIRWRLGLAGDPLHRKGVLLVAAWLTAEGPWLQEAVDALRGGTKSIAQLYHRREADDSQAAGTPSQRALLSLALAFDATLLPILRGLFLDAAGNTERGLCPQDALPCALHFVRLCACAQPSGVHGDLLAVLPVLESGAAAMSRGPAVAAACLLLDACVEMMATSGAYAHRPEAGIDAECLAALVSTSVDMGLAREAQAALSFVTAAMVNNVEPIVSGFAGEDGARNRAPLLRGAEAIIASPGRFDRSTKSAACGALVAAMDRLGEGIAGEMDGLVTASSGITSTICQSLDRSNGAHAAAGLQLAHSLFRSNPARFAVSDSLTMALLSSLVLRTANGVRFLCPAVSFLASLCSEWSPRRVEYESWNAFVMRAMIQHELFDPRPERVETTEDQSMPCAACMVYAIAVFASSPPWAAAFFQRHPKEARRLGGQLSRAARAGGALRARALALGALLRRMDPPRFEAIALSWEADAPGQGSALPPTNVRGLVFEGGVALPLAALVRLDVPDGS